MAVIALPRTIRFATSVAWQLDRPAQVNVSGYTGRRQIVANPWHGKWSAKVELAPIVGENNMLQWRAFLAALKGQINTFHLPASEGPQHNGTFHTTGGAVSAGATAMTLNGSPTMTAGMMVTFVYPSGNKQLAVLTSVSGTSVTFEPPLREALPSGWGVETKDPYAHVALTSSTAGWTAGKGKVYGIMLDVEEAY